MVSSSVPSSFSEGSVQHQSTPYRKRFFTPEPNTVLEALIVQKYKTQAKFARALKVNRSYVNRLIKGTQIPDRATMIQAAGFLGVDSRTVWP